MSESESTASGVSTDDKTATVQYKPVTSLTDNSNAHAHYSHVAMNKHHMHYPIFMACTGAAIRIRVSCQAVSHTNGLSTRLV